MQCWLNIHDPDPIGHINDNKVYLKEIHENTAYNWIERNDIGVIYEIGWRRGDTVRGSKGEPVALKEGRKGIVALIEIGKFHEVRYEYNEDRYLGWFSIKRIIRSSETGSLISLHDLNKIWFENFEKNFSPRINGGLRKLNIHEWNVIAGYLGI